MNARNKKNKEAIIADFLLPLKKLTVKTYHHNLTNILN